MFGPLDNDAFSSGQISSKLWLCKEIEKLPITSPQTIWVFGGWYGVASMLLLSRETLPIKSIRSFDLDPICESIADSLLENWVWQEWKFKAMTADCNQIKYNEYNLPDIIINTSTEHFDSMNWFNNIPSNTTVVLQSNNMPHDDHISCFENVDEFVDHFPLTNIFYKGKLDFKYPNWEFSRYMIIGKK